MRGLSAANAVALACHYDSREEMIEMTGIDPETIDDDDPRTWPPIKVVRTIHIDVYAGGGFGVRDGERYSGHLIFDEMLGTIAALTMPLPPPCLQWMQTKEQHDAREEHFAKLREQRKAERTHHE